MRILVDMDGVIADFELAFLSIYRNRHPDKPFIPLEQRTNFYIMDQYPQELRPLIKDICFSKWFFLGLPPIEGSIKALLEMKSRGDEVYICSSPLLSNPYCIEEKYEWVKNYLGEKWIQNVVITKDKTIIHGDFLIDDKPEVKGIQTPTWEHVLYSQPYNMQIDSKRRLTWKDWNEVIR